MNLRVKPIYGWGWRDDSGAIEVPSPFEFDAEKIPTEHDSFCALGQVPEISHPLSKKWVLLSQRHTVADAYCNLAAFTKKPEKLFGEKSCVSGFAEVQSISE